MVAHTSPMYRIYFVQQQTLTENIHGFYKIFFTSTIKRTQKHIHTHTEKRQSRHSVSKPFQPIVPYTLAFAVCCVSVIYRQSFLIFHVHLAARAHNISSHFIFSLPFWFSFYICFVGYDVYHRFDGCPVASTVHECILVPLRLFQKPITSTLDAFKIRFGFMSNGHCPLIQTKKFSFDSKLMKIHFD